MQKLKQIKPLEVSLVGTPANLRKFALMKNLLGEVGKMPWFRNKREKASPKHVGVTRKDDSELEDDDPLEDLDEELEERAEQLEDEALEHLIEARRLENQGEANKLRREYGLGGQEKAQRPGYWDSSTPRRQDPRTWESGTRESVPNGLDTDLSEDNDKPVKWEGEEKNIAYPQGGTGKQKESSVPKGQQKGFIARQEESKAGAKGTYHDGVSGMIGSQKATQQPDEIKARDTVRKGGTPSMNEILKGLDLSTLPDGVSNAIQTLFKAQEEAIEKAEKLEEIVKAEKDRRLTEEAVAFAKGLSWGEVDQLAMVVKTARQIMPIEAVQTLEKHLIQASELIKNSQVFREVGVPGMRGAGGGAWAKIEQMAQGIVQKDNNGMTKEQAISLVMEKNPDLYQEYLDEQAASRR